MKAMLLNAYGDADAFTLGEIPTPVAGPGEVLVRVHGSSVNPLDAGIRAGMLSSFVPLELPAVLGVDVAGEVVAVGEGVARYGVGDRVYAYTGVGAGGGYGEFAAVAVEKLARVPENLGLVGAGSVPGVGATAFEAFTIQSRVEAGMRVFINGAAGGVGTYGIQVARALGAEVSGTCSAAKTELVVKLGARAIDYGIGDPFSEVGAYDVVLNAVRATPNERLLPLLRDGGTLVTVVGGSEDVAAAGRGELGGGKRVAPFFVNSDSVCLEGLSELLASGAVTPVIEGVYPLAELADAHRRVETGRVVGKLCVDVISGASGGRVASPCRSA